MTALDSLQWCCRLGAVAPLLASAEMLAVHESHDDFSLMSWSVSRTRDRYYITGAPGRFFARIYSRPGMVSLLTLRSFACLLLLLPLWPHWGTGMLAVVVALTTQLLTLRCPYGLDGSDQMMFILHAAAGFGLLLPGPVMGSLACAFVACMSAVSYALSGTAKAVSPQWRSGAALTGIMGTKIYGHATAHRLFLRWPIAARGVSFFGIAWECSFPVVFVLPDPWALAVLGVGLSFHLGCAVLMGLNTFLWAFVATYPAVWWMHEVVRGSYTW